MKVIMLVSTLRKQTMIVSKVEPRHGIDVEDERGRMSFV